jgi:hypothetical protein
MQGSFYDGFWILSPCTGGSPGSSAAMEKWPEYFRVMMEEVS